MGKISPVSAKYIIHAQITIDGTVDRPDVIGAIFGQTEGLLGADLELRELQRSGRIGRIEVNTDTKSGKTSGEIVIPSSLDKAETAIVAAALEIIQRIGPCNAKMQVKNIEDVRISKRSFVVERAKELLKNLMDNVLPDSREIADEVAQSVRVLEIVEYGLDKLPAGPAIEESEEIIVVEGRADVLNLLKHGFKNAIAVNGTSIPNTIIELVREKVVTVFVDGDRGGNLILKELLSVADIDFVTRAPDGKEVEEITNKEIHKALRSRITLEQAKAELDRMNTHELSNRHHIMKPLQQMQRPQMNGRPMMPRPSAPPVVMAKPGLPPRPVLPGKKSALTEEEAGKFKSMIEELVGTRGGYILDNSLNILGKVPTSELLTTIKSLNTGMYAVVFDGPVDKAFAKVAERANIAHVIGMSTDVRPGETTTNVMTASDM
ncbi:DNA primase [Candidatus Woesearchaeota archaeon]|nr:DNA primase [Candidatus Woesearchaeota archaeon]